MRPGGDIIAKTNSKLSDSLNEVSVVEYGETLKTRDLVERLSLSTVLEVLPLHTVTLTLVI